jgi:hypothetical protein
VVIDNVEYKQLMGFDFKNQILIPISTYDDFAKELDTILVLGKFFNYEVISKSDGDNLNHIIMIHHEKQKKYHITLSCMNNKIAMFYIFSIYPDFEKNNSFVNDKQTMISTIVPEEMINCMRLFQKYIF